MFSLIRAARWLLALMWAAAVALPVGAQQGPDASQRRVALVIGNNACERSPRVNSVNDAQAMASAHESIAIDQLSLTEAATAATANPTSIGPR